MKYSDLMNVKSESGSILTVNGETFQVDQVSNYKSRTASWLNLIDQSAKVEKVLELSDGDIRLWTQVLDLPDVSPDMDVVDYRGHHFEVDESRVRAKTETRNAVGELQTELSITSVYIDEKDEDVLLSIELKGNRLFVWYSAKMIAPKDIKMLN